MTRRWNQVFLCHEFPDLKFDLADYLSILCEMKTRGASHIKVGG
jgi:hypothetical protein